jgi:hypothetical protein
MIALVHSTMMLTLEDLVLGRNTMRFLLYAHGPSKRNWIARLRCYHHSVLTYILLRTLG